MNIAVLGASGFVGINLISALLSRGHTVLGISLEDPPLSAKSELLSTPLAFAKADVLDSGKIKSLLRAHGSEAIFHGATITAGLDRERREFARIVEVNVLGTAKLLEAAHHADVKRVVLASSSAVYGDAVFGKRPLREDIMPTPVTLYGISKLAAEQTGLRFGLTRGIEVRVLRIAAVFGAWERDTGVRDTLSPMFQIARQAVRGEIIRIPQSGSRDWIDAGRVALAIAKLIENEATAFSVYNFAAAAPWHPASFCETLALRMPKVRWEAVADARAATVQFNDDLSRTRRALETDRILDELGRDLAPDTPADLVQFADWVCRHPTWFQG